MSRRYSIAVHGGAGRGQVPDLLDREEVRLEDPDHASCGGLEGLEPARTRGGEILHRARVEERSPHIDKLIINSESHYFAKMI